MISLKKQIRLKEDEIAVKKQVAKDEVEHIKETLHKGLTSPLTLLGIFGVGYFVGARILRKTHVKSQLEPQQSQVQQKSVEKAVAAPQPKLNFTHVLAFMGFIVDVALLAQRLLK